MDAFWRAVTCAPAAVALLSLSPHSGPAQEPVVAPPERAATPAETVELEVPPGMPMVVEVGEGSRCVRDGAESRIEGVATITLGKNPIAWGGEPAETLRLLRQGRHGDALRLRIHHSRITVDRGQPNYPSHIFIEPLPVEPARK